MKRSYYESMIAGVRYYIFIDIKNNIAEVYIDEGVARKTIDSFGILCGDSTDLKFLTMDYTVKKKGACEYAIINNTTSDVLVLQELEFEYLMLDYILLLFRLKAAKRMLKYIKDYESFIHNVSVLLEIITEDEIELKIDTILEKSQTRGLNDVDTEKALSLILLTIPEFIRIYFKSRYIVIKFYIPSYIYYKTRYFSRKALCDFLIDCITIKASEKSLF